VNVYDMQVGKFIPLLAQQSHDVTCFQVCTVHDFMNSPSAAKLEQLGENRDKILLDFLGVSRQINSYLFHLTLFTIRCYMMLVWCVLWFCVHPPVSHKSGFCPND